MKKIYVALIRRYFCYVKFIDHFYRRIISVLAGTFAIVSLMVGELIQGQVNPILDTQRRMNITITPEYDTELRLKYAVTASFLVGLMQVSDLFADNMLLFFMLNICVGICFFVGFFLCCFGNHIRFNQCFSIIVFLYIYFLDWSWDIKSWVYHDLPF